MGIRNAIGAASVALLFGLSGYAAEEPVPKAAIIPGTTVAQQWQYTSTPLCRSPRLSPKAFETKFHAKLNEFGALGFELVSIFPYKFTQMNPDQTDCMFAVFKRPIERTK